MAAVVREPATLARPAPAADITPIWPLVVVTSVVVVPFVALLVRAVIGHWDAAVDHAAIELRTRAVGGSDTPLVGPYSRYGWSHPGPLLFYALALPYHALGSESTGILAGAVVVNACAVACISWVLWRRARVVGLMLGIAPLVLLMHAVGARFLEDPWNPYIVVLPLFALALVTWTVACGDHWLFPLVILFASFASQSHIGTALPCAALLMIATTSVVVDARRASVTKPRRLAVVSVALALVLWLPALIDQFRPGGGNLGEVWRFWFSHHESMPGFLEGARLVDPQLGIRPSFVTGAEPRNPFSGGLNPSWTVPVALLVLVVAIVWAAKRRDREAAALGTVALTLAATAWISAARIVGVPIVYLLRWTWVVGALTWLAIAWTVMRAVRSRRRIAALLGALSAVAVIGGVGLVTATTVSAARTDHPVAQEAHVVEILDAQLVRRLRGTRGPVLIRPAGSFRSGFLASGVVDRLVHRGIKVGLERKWEFVVGSAYVLRPQDARVQLVVAGPDDDLDAYKNDPRYRELARYDSLSSSDRAERTRLSETIRRAGDRLAQWVTAHPAEWRRLNELNANAMGGAVYEVR
jgi:hypothetical protein